jgi:hypothetical protein
MAAEGWSKRASSPEVAHQEVEVTNRSGMWELGRNRNVSLRIVLQLALGVSLMKSLVQQSPLR